MIALQITCLAAGVLGFILAFTDAKGLAVALCITAIVLGLLTH